MMETITIEFTDEEYGMIAKAAKEYGKTAEEYCQALADWMVDPENKELLDYYFRHAVQEEKRREFDQLVSKGMEPIYANYHVYGRVLAVAVKPDRDYTLLVKFNNGETRRLDCRRYICGVGAFLENKADFHRVQVDEYGIIYWDIDSNIDSNVVWENVYDICPHDVYELSELLETEEV